MPITLDLTCACAFTDKYAQLIFFTLVTSTVQEIPYLEKHQSFYLFPFGSSKLLVQKCADRVPFGFLLLEGGC
jgi:hypothetical protein